MEPPIARPSDFDTMPKFDECLKLLGHRPSNRTPSRRNPPWKERCALTTSRVEERIVRSIRYELGSKIDLATQPPMEGTVRTRSRPQILETFVKIDPSEPESPKHSSKASKSELCEAFATSWARRSTSRRNPRWSHRWSHRSIVRPTDRPTDPHHRYFVGRRLPPRVDFPHRYFVGRRRLPPILRRV